MGKRAPLNRKIGRTMKLNMRLNPSILSVNEAINNPIPARPKDMKNITIALSRKISGGHGDSYHK